MGSRTRDRIAAADPEALEVYDREDRAAQRCGTRHYASYSELVTHVETIVCSQWWETTFSDAPIEVHVQRRSRNATFSAAGCNDEDWSADLWIVDRHGWNTHTVLHELAHVAAGNNAHHGKKFRDALLELWRHEAGFYAYVELQAEFDTLPTPPTR